MPQTKPSLGCHYKHLPPHVCLREPGSRDSITDNGATSSVPKWYVTTIDIYMTSPNVAETYRRKTLQGGDMLWLDSWIWKSVKLNLNDSYCNGYVCKCMWLTPHDSTCHNYDAFLKWGDDQLSSTGAPAQHERCLTGSFCRLAGYTVNSNTGCFEVGPAVVCGVAIFKKPQQGHRCNVSLRYEWFWEMSYIFDYCCLFWVGCVKWLG